MDTIEPNPQLLAILTKCTPMLRPFREARTPIVFLYADGDGAYDVAIPPDQASAEELVDLVAMRIDRRDAEAFLQIKHAPDCMEVLVMLETDAGVLSGWFSSPFPEVDVARSALIASARALATNALHQAIVPAIDPLMISLARLGLSPDDARDILTDVFADATAQVAVLCPTPMSREAFLQCAERAYQAAVDEAAAERN